MVSFVVDENHLRRLSPEARRELLQVLSADVADLKGEFADEVWDPESNTSYPLDAEEARILIRGMPEPARRMLRVFCRNYDGSIGKGELDELLEATEFTHYDDLGQEVSNITQRLRNVSGHPDAWMLNWHAKDWQWDEENHTYARGLYFISDPSISSLRTAFGLRQE